MPRLASVGSIIAGIAGLAYFLVFSSNEEPNCEPFLFLKTANSLEEITLPNTRKSSSCNIDALLTTAGKICESTPEGRIDLALRQADLAPGNQIILEVRDYCKKRNKSFEELKAEPRPTSHSSEPAPITSQFRYSHERTGYVSHPNPLMFASLEPKLRLPLSNVSIHTASKASPAVDETGIYVGSDSSWFFAYDHNGNLKWKFYPAGATRGIHSTAALDQEGVYLTTYSGRIYKLDKKTGDWLWAVEVGDAIGASPVLLENSVFTAPETFDPDGYVVRLRRSNGEIEWVSTKLGQQSHSTPTFDLQRQLLFLGDNGYRVRALDLQTGFQRWEFRAAAEIKATGAYDQDHVYYPSWDGFLYKFAADSGKVIWMYNVVKASMTSPSVWPETNGLLIGSNGGEWRLIALKDARLLWQTPELTAHSQIGTSVVIGNGKESLALVACEKFALCALDHNGNILQRTRLKGPLTGAPVVFGNRVFVAESEPGDLFVLKTKGSKDEP